MIQKKRFHFTYDDIDFDAMVTFNDSLFEAALRDNVFYRVQLLKPVELDCGGEFVGKGRGEEGENPMGEAYTFEVNEQKREFER